MATINSSLVLAGLCTQLAKEHNIKKNNIDVAYANIQKVDHLFDNFYVLRLALGDTPAIVIEYGIETDILIGVIYTDYEQICAFIKGIRRASTYFQKVIDREISPALKKLSIDF